MPIIISTPFRNKIFFDDFESYAGDWNNADYDEVILFGPTTITMTLDGSVSAVATVDGASDAGQLAMPYNGKLLSHGTVRCKIHALAGSGGGINVQPGVCGRFIDANNYLACRADFFTDNLRIVEFVGGVGQGNSLSFNFITGTDYYIEMDYTATDPTVSVYSNADYTGLLAQVTLTGVTLVSEGKAGMHFAGDQTAVAKYDDLYIISP